MIEFAGVQKTTLADFPGHVACTFFTSGCNFRCPFCYNPSLVFSRDTGIKISEAEALDFLRERKKLLEAVCLTGGEPLMHKGLSSFLSQAKNIGYLTKLDTNGAYPLELEELLEKGLLDYIAVDIKGPPSRYDEYAGVKTDLKDIGRSLALLKSSGIEHELRTTVFSGLNSKDFKEILEWTGSGKRYYIQELKMDVELLDPDFTKTHQPLSKEEMEEIASLLRSGFTEVAVRA